MGLRNITRPLLQAVLTALIGVHRRGSPANHVSLSQTFSSVRGSVHRFATRTPIYLFTDGRDARRRSARRFLRGPQQNKARRRSRNFSAGGKRAAGLEAV